MHVFFHLQKIVKTVDSTKATLRFHLTRPLLANVRIRERKALSKNPTTPSVCYYIQASVQIWKINK